MIRYMNEKWEVVAPESTSGWGTCISNGIKLIARMTGRYKLQRLHYARLIAATPDLYDALVEIATLYDHEGTSDGCHSGCRVCIAEKALTKAWDPAREISSL